MNTLNLMLLWFFGTVAVVAGLVWHLANRPKPQQLPTHSQVLTITDISSREVTLHGKPVHELTIHHRLALEKGDFTPEFIKEEAARAKVKNGANYFTRRMLLYTSEFQASRAVCIVHHHQENHLANKFVVNSRDEWLTAFYPVDAR